MNDLYLLIIAQCFGVIGIGFTIAALVLSVSRKRGGKIDPKDQ